MKNKKILILGRVKDKNLGDVIIADTCGYILRIISNPFLIGQKVYITKKNIFEKNEIFRFITDYDAIVVPGGGINSFKFCNAIKAILDTEDNVKLYFNAVGIGVKNKIDLKQELKKVINDTRVIQFTTRGDYYAAKEYLEKKKKYSVELILDPAIWASETYKIKKVNDSQIVGIGIIRAEIFKEYGNDISEDEITYIYKGLFIELDKRNIKWQVFCNGTKRDYNYAEKLLKELQYNVNTQLALRPEKAEELVETIAQYKGIIAARFHANIIATSLNIPSIALVWNNKMDGFSELIGCKERYIKEKEKMMDSKQMVDSLLRAIDEGYDIKRIKKEKKRTIRVMKRIIQ